MRVRPPFFNLLFHAMRVYFYFFLKRIAIAQMRVRPTFTLSKTFFTPCTFNFFLNGSPSLKCESVPLFFNLLFHAMRVYFFIFFSQTDRHRSNANPPPFLSKLFAKARTNNFHFLAPELRSFDFSIAPGDT